MPVARDNIVIYRSVEAIDKIATSADPIDSIARLSDFVGAAVISFPGSRQLVIATIPSLWLLES